jgi:hypothetical protein
MKKDLTIEELEDALSMPSFEEELALTDLSKQISEPVEKVARLVTCRICGAQVMVGPDAIFSCPNAPHDPEDDLLSEDDVVDEDIFEVENEYE